MFLCSLLVSNQAAMSLCFFFSVLLCAGVRVRQLCHTANHYTACTSANAQQLSAVDELVRSKGDSEPVRPTNGRLCGAVCSGLLKSVLAYRQVVRMGP